MKRSIVLAVASVLLPWSSRAQDLIWPDLTKPVPAVGGGEQDAALVIGVERYAFVPAVTGATGNALAWHDWLTGARKVPADRVVLLRDEKATVDAIRKEAIRVAQAAEPGSTLWFVFVGHGAPASDGKDGMLLGVDVQQDPDSLKARGLPEAELLDILQGTRAGAIRVVLDACFSGLIGPNRPLVPGLQPLVVTTVSATADPRFAILTAAQGGQFAGPLPGGGRPAFSYLVLGGLRGWADADADGRLTAGELRQFTTAALRATLRGREQTPLLVGDAQAIFGPSCREAGPDLALIARLTERREGPDFRVTALPAVPEATRPAELEVKPPSLSWEGVDVEALEKYQTALKVDRSQAGPDVKSKAWRDLAAAAPKFAADANKRAEEWARYDAALKAKAAAAWARLEARDRDWNKLKRLLLLEVVSDDDKRRWAVDFVNTYGRTYDQNPYAGSLAAFLPPGTVQGSQMGWSLIPAGRFQMGSIEGEDGRQQDEGPLHEVAIVRPFLLKTTEVTQGEWKALMRNNPSESGSCGDTCPVENVSWWDALVYCNALSRLEGKEECYRLGNCNGKAAGDGLKCERVDSTGPSCAGYRLPTEAEWEYAARSAGRHGVYPWGDKPATCDRAVGAIPGCGTEGPLPVCSKPAGNTDAGLCDMAGNVLEWVEDVYHSSYLGAPDDGSAWIKPDAGFRVARGGSWRFNGAGLRNAGRTGGSPSFRGGSVGFRPARSAF
jgi:formylglycine-generating enzyme required for sulfatase activity